MPPMPSYKHPNTFVTDIIHVQSGSIESIITFGKIGVGGVQTGRKMGLYIETIKVGFWITISYKCVRAKIMQRTDNLSLALTAVNKLTVIAILNIVTIKCFASIRDISP